MSGRRSSSSDGSATGICGKTGANSRGAIATSAGGLPMSTAIRVLELRARDAAHRELRLGRRAAAPRLRDVAAGDDAGGAYWFFVSVSEVSKAATLLSEA